MRAYGPSACDPLGDVEDRVEKLERENTDLRRAVRRLVRMLDSVHSGHGDEWDYHEATEIDNLLGPDGEGETG